MARWGFRPREVTMVPSLPLDSSTVTHIVCPPAAVHGEHNLLCAYVMVCPLSKLCEQQAPPDSFLRCVRFAETI